MKKQLNKLNKRLRITLSIMVLSLCTVFLFLSNSANAQTYQRVDYVKYNVNASGNPVGSNAVNITSTTLTTADAYSGTDDVLYSYFYANGAAQTNDNIKAIMVYKVPNGTSTTTNVLLTKTGTGSNAYYPISSVTDLRALSTFVMYDQSYGPLTSTKNGNSWTVTTDTSATAYPNGYWLDRLQHSNTYQKTFKLTQDITFTSSDDIYAAGTHNFTGASNFLPIGGTASIDSAYYYQYEHPTATTIKPIMRHGGDFSGTFDGQNHTITGLTILKNTSYNYARFGGLFGTSNNATISNINLTHANMSESHDLGVVVGACSYSNISNCHVSSSVVKVVGAFVGGISGSITGSYVSNCSVSNSIITGGVCIGGIIGSDVEYDRVSTVTNCSVSNSVITGTGEEVAGIVGQNISAHIYNCSVESTNIEGYFDVAGITGHVFGDYGDVDILNSYVKNSTMRTTGYSTADNCAYCAGICAHEKVGAGNIKNCYVISSRMIAEGDKGNGVGGIVGNSSSDIASEKIENCYVTGCELKGNAAVGGIVAISSNIRPINNCYVTATSIYAKTSTVGGICGLNKTANTAPITNCYSAATLSLNGTPQYNCVGTGDLMCETNITSTTPAITNSYYLVPDGTAETNGAIGNARHSSTMQALSFIATLGNTSYEAAPTSTNYTYNYNYPILTAVQKNGSNYLYETMIATPKSTMVNGDVITINSTTDVPTSPIVLNDGQQLINATNNDVEAFVNKSLVVNKWNLIGSEMNSNIFHVLNDNTGITTHAIHDMAALAYDYTTNNWSTNYMYAKDAMNVGEGYFVYPLTTALDGTTDLSTDVTTTLHQYGILNNAATTQITKTTAIANGWVSLANPYPANISAATTSTIGLFSHDNSANMQSNVIYTFIPSSNSWVSNITGSTGQITVIKPGEGFVVASDATVGEKTYTITKPTSSVSKSAEVNNSLIKFTSQANNTVKEAFATINDEADNSFDQRDAFVMLSTRNEDLVEPYFIVENRQILKDEFKTLPYYAPMNFHASKESNTNLTVNNIPENVNVSIIDLSNGNETALENGSAFNFVANQGENEGRFVVKFGKSNVGLDNTAEENEISLAMYPNPATTQTTLFVDGLTNNAQVNICDIQGRIINTYTINNNQSTLKINTSNLASGVYYIRVVSNNLTKTEKLVVK
jgi:hypothetical protein